MSSRVKGKGLAFAFVVLSLSTSAFSQSSWVIGEDCEPHELEQKYVAHIKGLSPKDQGYLPEPFPTTNREVIRNFESEFARLWSSDPGKATVAKGIKYGTVAYQVLPITNWGRSRCADPTRAFRNRANFLLRVFDSRSGREIARARANQDGTIAALAVGDYDRTEFMDIDKALQILAQDGATVPGRASLRGGQLVKSNGGLACRDLEPCVAFQSDQGPVILERTRFGVRFAVESVEHVEVSSIQGREFGELVRSEQANGRTAVTAGNAVVLFRVIDAKKE